MAVRTITTRLTVDGEKEFKKQLSEVNSNLKTMKSEMELVDAEFKGNANTLDALTEKNKILRKEQEQQTEKVKALEKAVQDAAEAYGESDKRTDGYRQQLNRAKKELVYMNDALDENERYLDEAKNSADKCAKSIDGFGKEVKDSKKDLDGFGNELEDAAGNLEDLGNSADSAGGSLGGSGGLLQSLGEMKGLLTGGALVVGAKAVSDAVTGVVEDTAEYRKIMGTLEVSSKKAGYSAEDTATAYKYLNGVLGDSQASATTIANLQAIGFEQEDLMTTLNGVIGAWATYGDSIPIDGLAESINETIQAGKVTGVFADVLNWAGMSEDVFNARLELSATEAERAQKVMDVLAKQGLTDVGVEWREVNSDIVEYNEAQERANEAMAELGERLTPLAASVKETFAGAVTVAIDTVEAWIDALDRAATKIKEVIGLDQEELSYMRENGYTSTASQNALLRRGITSSTAAEEAEDDWRTSRKNGADIQAESRYRVDNTVNIKVNLDGKEVANTVTKYQTQNMRANQ